jgi:hypothetical protein
MEFCLLSNGGQGYIEIKLARGIKRCLSGYRLETRRGRSSTAAVGQKRKFEISYYQYSSPYFVFLANIGAHHCPPILAIASGGKFPTA